MPRPTPYEKLYDERSYQRRAAWPAILLASPVGLLIAMIVISEMRSSAPAIIDAGAAGMSTHSQSIAAPAPFAVPAAIGGPALGTTKGDRQSTREMRTVPAATLKALLADPAVRDFKGLSENAWDFNQPAEIPGFGPGPAADRRHELELFPDE